MTEENSSGDDVDHASDVDSDLVLDKLADVVLNITSPSDGGDNSHEVVVHKDDVSVVLGGGTSVFSHGEANVGLAKGTRVGETLTGDGDACLRLSEGTGEHVFKLWAGSVDDHHRFLEVSLEALHGFGVDEIVRFTTTLIVILTFLHERSEKGHNIGSRVAEFSFVDVIGELNLDGGGHDGHLAVTREDSDVGATVTELVDSIVDTFSERIGEADSGDHGKVLLNDSARLFGLEVAILHLEGLEVLGANVNVSEGKSLETSGVVDRLAVIDGGGRATDDDLFDDSFVDVVGSLLASAIERASLSVGVKSACAQGDNDFGGTLNDDTGSLALVKSVGDSHALAVRAERNPELEVVLVLTLNELVLDGDALAGDELEETDIDGAADSLVSIFLHLHASIAVEDDGLLKGLLELNVSLEVAGVEGLSLGGNTFDLHVTSGKGGGLSSKDVNDLTSGLKSVQVLDEKIVILQLVDGESHGHRDDKRHTFGDADGKESTNSGTEVDGTLDGGTINELVVAAHNKEEPDGGEDDESGHADNLGIGANDTGENLELLLERSGIVLDLESILVVLEVFFDLTLLHGVLTNSEDDSFAGSGHDDGVLEEDGVRVVADVHLDVVVAALLFGHFGVHHVCVELFLVNLHIHFLNEEAVSGATVTLVKKDNVTNDEVLNIDGLGGSVGTTEDGNFFVHNFLTEAQKLLLFTPVAEGLDQSGENHGKVDRDGLEPLVLHVLEQADDQRGGTEDKKDLHVELVELVPQDGPERADSWQRSLVFAEAKLTKNIKQLGIFETKIIITISFSF